MGTSKNPITQKMEEGILSGVFPGAVLLVSHNGKITFHKSFGLAQQVPSQIPLTINTLFDLASLTKPLATAAAITRLITSKQIRLNHPISQFFDAFKTEEKRKITIAHLLHHSSGLPAWKPYYEEIIRQDKKKSGFLGSDAAKQKVYEMAANEALIGKPGAACLYSDIGFILLGAIIEKVSGLPLPLFCENQIFSKLKCKKTGFPLMGKTTKGIFAATENCPWRKRVICGQVHDDNAYAMGGAAGHAGLFSTAKDVWLLVTDWMASIKEKGTIDSSLAKKMITRKVRPKGGSFGLGWDTPSGESASGHFLSKRSFGHLGFTGTSVFSDCVNDLIVVLLTNRVHPTRNNDKIKAFRPEIHDLIFKEVIGG